MAAVNPLREVPTKVRVGCVQAVLRRATANGEDGDSVAAIAFRAGRSPRTIYRVLGYEDDKLLDLDLADRLLLAAGGHLSIDCQGDEVEFPT